jgi:DNA-binding transcriptional LysR family regulator
MDLQRYNHFLAVVDAAHFGRAAAQLGMKQPPLSQSIARLERDLGVVLFERTPRGARLTKAGEAFLPEARVAVAAAQRAATLARAAGADHEPLRVGVVSVALFEILADVLAAGRHVGIPVRIDYASTNDQLAGLAKGSLDLGFVTPPFEAPARLQVTWVANEPIQAALPSASLAGDDGAVSLAAIHDRLILFRRSDGPVLHDAILALFRAQGLTPSIVQETPATMLATLALVAAGVGVSVVPAAIARNVSVAGVAFRPLVRAEGVPTWPVAMAHMPLSANSPVTALLAAWRREGGVLGDGQAPHPLTE